MINVLVAVDGLSMEQRRRIEAGLLTECRALFLSEEASRAPHALQGIDVVFGWPDPTALEQSSVRFHQLPSSGYDSYLALRNKKGFCLANARGVCAQAVAEHCVSMMFAFTRRTIVHATQQSEKVWKRAANYELVYGKTLCIIGMGAIGTALASLGRGLGMEVIAVTRHGEKPPSVTASYSLESLNESLRISDHIAIALPSLPGDRPLFSVIQFANMRSTAYLYSLGRGSHVDQEALLLALRNSQIAGAGLDVFQVEPLPADDPLWNDSRLLISPHAGGRFADEMDRLIDLLLENVRAFCSHSEVKNLVIGQPGSQSMDEV